MALGGLQYCRMPNDILELDPFSAGTTCFRSSIGANDRGNMTHNTRYISSI